MKELPDKFTLMWGRDGKSLQNSTRKTSSLKNLHTKYVQKMPKIVLNLQNCTKLHKKGQKTFIKRLKNKTKIAQL